MISYYGIDNTNPEKLKVSPNAVAELRLATEVFRDLVSMGAITLPPGISADDYELRINAKQYPIQVELSKKSNPKQQKHVISHPHRMLSERVTFGSNEALLLIRNLLKVSEEL
jgi:hypothetical protein